MHEPTDDDVRALERTRLRALVAGDVVSAERMHAQDYELITPGGAALTRGDYLHAVAAGALRYDVFEPISPIGVLRLGDGAALRYRARIQVRLADGSIDDAIVWHTDIYAARGGRWQVVWSHATRAAEEES
jgi:hypothetical protein